MSRRPWQRRVVEMVEAMDRIARLAQGRRAEEFDEATLGAVLYCFAIIGEAAGHMPLDVRTKYPEVPWTAMKRMRNVVVHAYFGIDPARLQSTIEKDIPEALRLLKVVIDEASKE